MTTALQIATTGRAAPLATTPDTTPGAAKWHSAHFDSLEDMLAAAVGRLPKVNENADTLESINGDFAIKKKGALAWHGIEGGTAAVMSALSHGYAPGIDMIEALLAKLPASVKPPVSRLRRRAWGDAGDSVDMQRVYAGTIDRAFSRTTRQAGRAPKIIRLVVAINGNHKVLATEQAWRGVAALALTKLLTDAGYAVEIIAAYASVGLNPKYKTPNFMMTTTLKQARSPLDLSTLASSMTIMGFPRHVGFAVKAHIDAKIHSAFGAAVWPETTPYKQDGDVMGFQTCTDAATAATFVNAKLAEIEASK